MDSEKISQFLSRIQPFKAMVRPDIDRITSFIEDLSFSRGETIYSEGDSADGVWVLYKGRVQVLKFVGDGKPFAIESLGPGELFGTLCRMGGNGRTYPCTAVAASATSVLKLPDQVFLEYYNKSPGFVRGMCSLCAERLKDVQDLRCMGQEPVPVRVAAVLARLHLVHGAELPFTKKEVAELAGTALETTFRTLAEFQKKGYLTSGRGKILIKKPDSLKALLSKSR